MSPLTIVARGTDNVVDATGDAARATAKVADDAARATTKVADDVTAAAAKAGKEIDPKTLSDVAKQKLVTEYITKLKAKTATAADKKNIDNFAKSIKSDSELATFTGESISETAKKGGRLDLAKKWFTDPANKKSVDLLIKAGLVAGGLALLMFMTGETNPLKAAEELLKRLAEGAANAAKTVLDGFLDSITEFFSKFKWWIIGFGIAFVVGFILVLLL